MARNSCSLHFYTVEVSLRKVRLNANGSNHCHLLITYAYSPLCTFEFDLYQVAV